MSKLILTKSEFEHLLEGSCYNNNYYMNKKDGYVIFEECDEEYDTYTFYLMENEQKVFIGCSNNGFGIGNDPIEIDFKVQYT